MELQQSTSGDQDLVTFIEDNNQDGLQSPERCQQQEQDTQDWVDGEAEKQEEEQIKDEEDGRALNLIYYDPDSKAYQVSQEATEFLRSVSGNVGVIAVAGKYRTGKSFLLNRVILNKRNSGFGVGPTINPCTKGLWVWSKPVETVDNNG